MSLVKKRARYSSIYSPCINSDLDIVKPKEVKRNDRNIHSTAKITKPPTLLRCRNSLILSNYKTSYHHLLKTSCKNCSQSHSKLKQQKQTKHISRISIGEEIRKPHRPTYNACLSKERLKRDEFITNPIYSIRNFLRIQKSNAAEHKKYNENVTSSHACIEPPSYSFLNLRGSKPIEVSCTGNNGTPIHSNIIS